MCIPHTMRSFVVRAILMRLMGYRVLVHPWVHRVVMVWCAWCSFICPSAPTPLDQCVHSSWRGVRWVVRSVGGCSVCGSHTPPPRCPSGGKLTSVLYAHSHPVGFLPLGFAKPPGRQTQMFHSFKSLQVNYASSDLFCEG